MASAFRNVTGGQEDKKTKRCKWRECSTKIEFKTIEEVLEHVLREHIPKVVKDEDGEEEVICEWDLCEMGTIRGDLEKKTSWMQNHFKARHMKNAKTFKCLIEGCHEVRATSQEIETHVRLSHFSKKKNESVSSSKEPSATPQPEEGTKTEQIKEDNVSEGTGGVKKVWKIVDGKVFWEPPMKVTKKTIVHYEDGPRYVYPTGCARCNYDSDESELASDEYWSPVFYSDDEETIRKSWRPPKNYHPVYNPGPSWYDPNNPPVTDSEEEARRRRPKRVKKKKPAVALSKKDKLHGVIDRITSNIGKTREEIEREKEPGWVGSFWHQYLEKQKKLENEEEPTTSTMTEPELDEREISEPPQLIQEPLISPKRSKLPKEMPSLKAHYDESADSESEDPEPKRKVLKRKAPKKVHFKEVDELKSEKRMKIYADSEAADGKAGRGTKQSASVESPSKTRPHRACRPNYSFCESDEDFALKVEIECPTKEEEVKRMKKVDKLKKVEKGKRIKRNEIEKSNSLLGPKLLKRAKSPVETGKRPKRACRVLGSMEEVPFFIEIGMEELLEGPEKIKRTKRIKSHEEDY